MSTPRSPVYEFGDFRVDARGRQLFSGDGRTFALTPKVFDTLLYLVEHPGVVLDKEDLMRSIWPDTVVEENNLNQAISAVRRVLGEARGENRYVVTVPGRGYRFVPEVREVSEAGSTRERDVTSASPATSPPPAALPIFRIIGAAAIVLAIVAAAIYARRSIATRTPSNAAAVRDGAASPSTVRSIAVLPFKPLVANHRDQSLEMGMADTLIVRLSNLTQIRVQPMTSVRRFGAIDQDAVIAGRALQVESVLDGSIQRDGDRIRVTARLLRVGDGQQLWAGQFDEKFTDVFAVQDVISSRIISALALRLTGEEQVRLTRRYTENAEAYQLYLSGRFHWQKRTLDGLKTAIEYFSQAIETDPDYALAHAGLADSYAILGVFHLPPKEVFPKGREAALNALRLDDRLAEAHASLGHIKVQYEYDWAGAEREYRRAIELNPDYANAHHFFAIYLAATGRFDDAVREIRRAQELEAFAPFIGATAAGILFHARRYDEALDQLHEVLKISPDLLLAHGLAGTIHLLQGDYDRAIDEFQRSAPVTIPSAGLASAYASSGRKREALEEVERLTNRANSLHTIAYDAALVYTSLGDKERAIDWLEKGYDERATMMIWINVDPRLDPLRSEPRFQALVKRMGLTS